MGAYGQGKVYESERKTPPWTTAESGTPKFMPSSPTYAPSSPPYHPESPEPIKELTLPPPQVPSALSKLLSTIDTKTLNTVRLVNYSDV